MNMHITIKTLDGDITLTAKQVSANGQWAIHQRYVASDLSIQMAKEMRKGYQITHLPTGMALHWCSKLADARKVVALLSERVPTFNTRVELGPIVAHVYDALAAGGV